MKLSKKYFGLNPHIHLSPSWISNGQFAVTRVSVDNLALFTSEAVARAALGNSVKFTERDTDQFFQARVDEPKTEWTVTRVLYEYGRTTCRVVQSTDGVIALIDRDYCDLLSIDPNNTIYNGQIDGSGPFTSNDTGEELTWIVMPVFATKECQSALDALTVQPVTLAHAV